MATVVAQYSTDFPAAGGDLTEGWSYHWNAPTGNDLSSGAIDSASTDFASLQDIGSGQGLSPDGDSNASTNPQSAYLKLARWGGHPGLGDGSATEHRYAIASYTVSESGFYQIAESFIALAPTNFNFVNDGVEFRVFINRDEPLNIGVVEPYSRNYFDTRLGFLKAGDTIHVAFGSNGQAFADTFRTDFQVVRDLSLEETVGSFRRDYFHVETQDYGWKYFWNAPDGWSPGQNLGNQRTGAIGDPASYEPLVKSGFWWTPDGDLDGANSAPDFFLRVGARGGQAGNGFDSSILQDRYSIIGFTVENSGLYAIKDSYLTVADQSQDGVELYIHVDDGERINPSTVVASGRTTRFDTSLGYLQKGDTIYVAMGSNNNHVYDIFETDFSIVRELPRAKPNLNVINHGGTVVSANVSHNGQPAAIPNDGRDDRAAIQAAIDYALSNGAREVSLEPGTYNLSPGPLANDRAFFQLIGTRDFVFNGNGSTILVDDFERSLFITRRSENVVFKDLTVDYAQAIQVQGQTFHRPLTFTQGKITAVDRGSQSFNVEINTEAFLAPNSSFASGGGSQAWGYAVDAFVDGRLKQNTEWHYPTFRLTPLGGNEFRIETNTTAGLAVGDRYVLQRRVNNPLIGIYQQSNNVSVVGVTAYSAPSVFVTGLNSRMVNVIDSHVMIRPDELPGVVDTQRWKSINADGVHIQSNRVGPWVENSTFNGLGDDVMNFYTRPMTVLERHSANRYTLGSLVGDELIGLPDELVKVGDRLSVFDTANGTVLRETKVVAVSFRMISNPIVPGEQIKVQTVTFDQNIRGIELGDPNDAGGYLDETTVYNRSLSQGGLVQDSELRNSRRYGNFLSFSNVQLIDNVYEGLSDEAIAAYNEPGWPLGLFADDLLIQGNEFASNGFSRRYLGEEIHTGTIGIHAVRYQETADSGTVDRLAGHQQSEFSNIRILDNDIFQWNKSAISVRNAQHVDVVGNTIVNGSADGSRPIQISDSDDVDVVNNSFSGGWNAVAISNVSDSKVENTRAVGTNGLTANYQFERGAFHRNAIRFSETATLNGAWARDGKFGYGAGFNGNSRLTINHGANSINTRTLSVWANINDVDRDSPQVIFEEGNGNAGLNAYVLDGQLYLGGWGAGFSTFLNTKIDAVGWQHIAIVLDANTNKMRGYLNGRKFSAGTFGAGVSFDGSLNLGAASSGTRFHEAIPVGTNPSYGLVGAIDELRIYDRVLGDREIDGLSQG